MRETEDVIWAWKSSASLGWSLQRAAGSGSECVFPLVRSSSLLLVELMAAGIALQALGLLRVRINLLGGKRGGPSLFQTRGQRR